MALYPIFLYPSDVDVLQLVPTPTGHFIKLFVSVMPQTLFTQKEKEQLIQSLRTLKAKQSEYLRREADRIAKTCERKVARRLNKVSVTIQSVKVQQVLELERKQSPTLADLRKVKNTTD